MIEARHDALNAPVVRCAPRPWRRRAGLWALSLGILILALGLCLRYRANPWRLQLTIPSGYDEAHYKGIDFAEPIQRAQLTEDGTLLAIARPNGQAEVWDLTTLRRRVTLGAVLEPERNEHPALGGAQQVCWVGDGRHLAVYREGEWQVFNLSGDRVPLSAETKNAWYVAATARPKPLLAVSAHGELKIINIPEGRAVLDWKLERWNGGSRRVQWTRDGRYLLANDWLGVRVWDMSSGQLVFCHRELDLGLPPPMIADARSGAATQRSLSAQNIAGLVDSQFAPDGSYVAVIYRDIRLLGSNPGTFRLRFYETATGRLLWDHRLPLRPRSMAFSSDGSRLCVLLCQDFLSTLQVYDPVRRQCVAEVKHPLPTSFFPPVPLTDARWVASCWGRLWLLDTQGRATPMRLPGSPSAAQVLVPPNGRQLIEVGLDKTARVWEQRRPMSGWGMMALPESWGIYFASIALAMGMAAIAARDVARAGRTRLPRALWGALAISAAGTGIQIGDRVIECAVEHLYLNDNPPSMVARVIGILGILFCIVLLLGVARLRPRWWITRLVVLGIILATLVLILGWLVRTRAAFPDSTVAWNGCLFPLTPSLVIPVLALIGVPTLLEAWLLLRPDVRTLYCPPSSAPGKAFPVIPID